MEYFILRIGACSIFCGIVLKLSKGNSAHEILRICCVFFMILVVLTTDFSQLRLGSEDIKSSYTSVVNAAADGTNALKQKLDEAKLEADEKRE